MDIAAGTMAKSGSSGSESLFGVDLERGSEGGEDKPVEAVTQQCNLHSHEASSTRFEQRVKRCYVGISLDRQLVAKRSSEPLKKSRPAALHLMNSVLVIVLVY